MSDWRQMVHEHDPGAERLDAAAAERIRDAVMRAARDFAPPRAVWPMRVALGAFACMVVMMSVVGRQRSIEVAPAHTPPEVGTERRQVRFATPGGTRIIWELNPDFTLMETLP
jgi:hypothetical protein